jgi:signal transduction histidine kinase
VSSAAAIGAPAGERLKVLLVEDDPVDKELVLRALRDGGFDPEAGTADTRQKFLECIEEQSYHIILADYGLPGWCGAEALELLQQRGLDIPVILVTGSLGDETAVECIKRGTTDYVLKDHLPRLPLAVRRALREKSLRDERRRAQEELARKVEELARSNRDLEQFAYVASHDLQEPLRMVANYTQLLAERYRGKLDEKADKYIGYAVDGAIRMQALINDLLVYSRIGRHQNPPQRVACDGIVQRAIRNLQAAIGESRAVVLCDPLPVVYADPGPLEQVFQNLISNAIKFHGPEPPRVKISAQEKGAQWVFSVVDNGIGIDSEYAETIFVIFKRLHSRTEYPGSGLGLAICKKIIEQAGGSIWVESEPGKGATFKFTLPIASDAVPEEAHEFAGRNSSGG